MRSKVISQRRPRNPAGFRVLILNAKVLNPAIVCGISQLDFIKLRCSTPQSYAGFRVLILNAKVLNRRRASPLNKRDFTSYSIILMCSTGIGHQAVDLDLMFKIERSWESGLKCNLWDMRKNSSVSSWRRATTHGCRRTTPRLNPTVDGFAPQNSTGQACRKTTRHGKAKKIKG